MQLKNERVWDFPSSPVSKSPPANEGDMGSVPGLGRFHISWNDWARVLQLFFFYSPGLYFYTLHAMNS